MKKISTAGVKQTQNFSEQKLTIGLDLGDRSSWYCVLDEAGEVLLEPGVERVGTRSDRGACAQRALDRGESEKR